MKTRKIFAKALALMLAFAIPAMVASCTKEENNPGTENNGGGNNNNGGGNNGGGEIDASSSIMFDGTSYAIQQALHLAEDGMHIYAFINGSIMSPNAIVEIGLSAPLHAGTYPIVNAEMPGNNEALAIAHTSATIDQDEDADFASGNMTVAIAGETYTIEITGVTTSNHNVTLHFSGTISEYTIPGMDNNGTLTVDGVDYNLGFAGKTTQNAEGTTITSIALFGVDGETGVGAEISLMTMGTFAAGTYTLGDYTALATGGYMGFIMIDDERYGSLTIASGSFTISISGNVYTFSGRGTTAEGNTFTFSYSGPCEDLSEE